ncbi:MAG: PadR family transcriptional regulator [Chloroflexi bacterium]|nr:MAG: PadR family transcriptional regulator [Chloroflexota bacterium]
MVIPSSTELVILGLLRRKPAHGYELLRTVRVQNMGDYIRLAPSGLYKALARLEDQGCITARAERDGNWPERQAYSITSKGEARLQKLLLDHLRASSDYSDYLNAALTFGDAAPPAVFNEELHRRREMVLGALVEADRLLTKVLPEVEDTFFARLRVERWAEHLAAEIKWLDRAIDASNDRSRTAEVAASDGHGRRRPR